MSAEFFEWMLLLVRWTHITTAIAWIGTSIFFMWLDRSFVANLESKRPGHLGELWMVHGGGFYHVEKLQMGPTRVPEHLHWFKWESYWTWLSGFFLLLTIFYTGSGTFLLDTSVSAITFFFFFALGLGSIVISWSFYDFIWERRSILENAIWGHALTLIWFSGISYFLCQFLSGRAAYIHVGAVLGTWMTFNVFTRIIPRQVKMVEAAKRGEPVNQDWSRNAKNRSTHNTYFTLPVIFIMLSNHFPMTYGHSLNWLILLVIAAAGAAIREYFVVRLSQPRRAYIFASTGIGLLLAVIVFSSSTLTAAPTLGSTEISGVGRTGTASVKGVVKFAGPIPLGEKLALPLVCGQTGEVYSNEIIVQTGRLKNVVVRIIKGLEGQSFPLPNEPVVIDQKGCIYEPRVSAARVGQKVDFLNSDATFHNVRAVARQNENFNVAMPFKGDRISKIFQNPEIVMTKCSLHPWMSAVIAVVDHPFFSITDNQGQFALTNLPAGNYTFELWHETLGSQVQDITVKDGEALNLEFTFKK